MKILILHPVEPRGPSPCDLGGGTPNSTPHHHYSFKSNLSGVAPSRIQDSFHICSHGSSESDLPITSPPRLHLYLLNFLAQMWSNDTRSQKPYEGGWRGKGQPTPGGSRVVRGGTREERYGLTRAMRDFRPHVCPDEAL